MQQLAKAFPTKKAWNTPRVEQLTTGEALRRILQHDRTHSRQPDHRRCG